MGAAEMHLPSPPADAPRASLVGANISANYVIRQLDARRGLNATRLHFPPGNGVPLDPISARRSGMLGVAPQINAGFQNLRFAQNGAAELRAVLVAMRRVDIAHPIVHDPVSGPDQEDAAELHSVQLIFFHHNILRHHFNTGIIEHNSEVAERIILRWTPVETNVAAHRAVMEAVQVDALAVDLFKSIVLVAGLLDISRRIDADGGTAVFDVDQLNRESNTRAGIALHLDTHGVAHLNGIPADLAELVAQDLSVPIARRHVAGMGPDGVTPDTAERGVRHGKLLHSFFQQNAARGVVAAFGIARSAIFYCNAIDDDILRMADEDSEIRDVYEIDALDGNIVTLFDQNAVVEKNAGESFVGWRQGQWLFEPRAIAVDSEIGKSDAAAAVAREDRAAVKIRCGVERAVIAGNG